MPANNPATKEQVRILKEHYGTLPAKEIASMLGWNVKRVYNEADKRRLSKRRKEMTPELLEEIKSHIPSLGDGYLCDIFGFSVHTFRKIRQGEYVLGNKDS